MAISRIFRLRLRSDSVHYYFVAEADDRVVGGGGISNYTPGGQATLAFGIVDPQLCRRGYGTSLLLARFLFIDPGPGGCVVSLEATEWSADFFARAGFRWYASSQDEHGNRFVSGYHHIPPGDRERFRRAFDDAGLTLCPEVAAAMGHAHVLSGIYAAEGRLTSG